MRHIRTILIFSVRVYRWTLSPLKTLLFGPTSRCRFHPSCSEYAIQALQTYGSCRGSWHALKRICRCHPWGGCGHDPVPAKLSPAEIPSEHPLQPIGRIWVPQTESISLDRRLGNL
ncbi:MAG: membrane protein insertion efficiency factor YidD [Verrucomicrobia bacterium]|nr:membrane protein insertion efficiency factor YidD [Verrucomicrobiota bacterium]